mmetsp:Transcript_29518/g.76225  ORF Transcript_29518/g.76225 Transcript_29518/m.76225 type:complete len:224 (-) Transcript_29518:437-1108(-)|eukprot:CAMPEP_0113916626 /NCGR_PEP_ID=MMETSP0780_2-20120614/32186_1 /TAXON_ID=652834 /ORGANISM="Palpitomonas bilix" /LENGTH=223 /DNA_ID=CAMNT_0000915915 /DNA_START=300 /DNA_END=971 /DNA_ORIENTATION=- /assembly_acc=CAM_ASM_000599
MEEEKVTGRSAADVNVQDFDGRTPLYDTAWYGHAEPAKLLLEYGADPCIKTNRGQDAIDAAIEKEHPNVLRHLIAVVADERLDMISNPSIDDFRRLITSLIAKASAGRLEAQGEKIEYFMSEESHCNCVVAFEILKRSLRDLGDKYMRAVGLPAVFDIQLPNSVFREADLSSIKFRVQDVNKRLAFVAAAKDPASPLSRLPEDLVREALMKYPSVDLKYRLCH